MATRTKEDQLNLGVPVEADGLGDFDEDDVRAYTDAFYTAVMGRRATPTNLGFYFRRISRIVPDIVVVANTVKAELPGPILNVQITAGFKTGQMEIILSGSPVSGEVLLTVDPVDGRDILTFDAGDAPTLIHYRQLGMPLEMHEALVADTEPPIDD
jgi:hypothetical protein